MPDSYTADNQSGAPPAHPMYERLPEYATMLALGETPPPGFDALEAHVAECAECQIDLDDLIELMLAAYSDRLEPACTSPPAKLAFLPSQQANLFQNIAPLPLVIVFSAQLLQSSMLQSLAGVARGRLLYHYVQDPQSLDDLAVSIDVYAEEALPGQGRVRISVAVPTRDPLEQAGSLVVLRADQARWDGTTDDLGLIDFAHVPLEALPHMRVEITPIDD